MKKIVIIFFCALLVSSTGFGQLKKKKVYNFTSKTNPFLQQQWWIGIKGGINASKVNVEKSYGIIAPTNYQQSLARKKYDQFKPIATHIALEATYFFKGFSASLQPTYQSIKFSYKNAYSWIDMENPFNRLDLSYKQEQQVAYMLIPIILKYEYNMNGITPYVQVGTFVGFLLNANKKVEVSGTDYASGGTNEIGFEPVMVGATDLFAKNHYGFIAGGGLYYNIGNIRLNLDVQYRLGQSLINSAENRYHNDRLAGIGDAMDDIKIDNVSVSLGTLFPLRFLSSGFKSYDK